MNRLMNPLGLNLKWILGWLGIDLNQQMGLLLLGPLKTPQLLKPQTNDGPILVVSSVPQTHYDIRP